MKRSWRDASGLFMTGREHDEVVKRTEQVPMSKFVGPVQRERLQKKILEDIREGKPFKAPSFRSRRGKHGSGGFAL
jgi:hypothetical protein